MNKWMKKLTAALCTAVLMCGMAVTAYAGGGEEWDGLDPVEPLPAETVDPGEGFTEDGNLVTRDLLYDKATNKQFITVQTSGGKGVPPNLPPKGSRCDGCPYWHGIGCVFCYREQLKPKTGGKHEP